MTEVGQIREAAAQLPERDRAELAVFLIEGLDATPCCVDDEEVERRRAELESGQISGLTVDEFKRSCER